LLIEKLYGGIFMKKFAFLGFISIALMILTFAACPNPGGNGGDDKDPDQYAAYYGTWKYTVSATSWRSVTISKNKLQYTTSDGTGGTEYTLENLQWVQHSNSGGTATSYPSGYIIKGTVTAKRYNAPPKPGSSTYANVGDIAEDAWYIHNNKQSLCWGSWSDSNKRGETEPFVKVVP
jgi:hypothetical protein